MKPHKHAELIHAWADGAEVERLTEIGDWLPDNDTPEWLEDVVYRIKPKEPVVRWLWVFTTETSDGWRIFGRMASEEEMQVFTDPWIDGPYTKYKKLEWSRQEFNE